MVYIYICILLLLAVFVLSNMFKAKDLFVKIDAALVLVPFILRLLMIK